MKENMYENLNLQSNKISRGPKEAGALPSMAAPSAGTATSSKKRAAPWRTKRFSPPNIPKSVQVEVIHLNTRSLKIVNEKMKNSMI